MRHSKFLSITVAAAMVLSSATISLAAGPEGAPPGSGSSTSVSYSGATEITSADTQSGQTYDSSTADQNALLINTNSSVTIENPTVTKSGDSDGGDNCNFYGINSAIMAKGGGTTTITGGTVTASAKGANGVFSYGGNGGSNGTAGDRTTVNISDTTIKTTGDNGGGIMTTGGGVTVAKNLTVTTTGQSSAPIRTDRGGGTVTVTGGTYTSSGQGSPAIYSTADITVNSATLNSNKSEGVCIEGQNSITLNNCTLTASNNALNGNAQFYDTIMIYQSQSGDAADGTSAFTMTGGNLNSQKGDVFHVTNTTAIITLKNVVITNSDSDNVLLSVCDDGWSGASNIATLNAQDQVLDGAILVGSDSTLNLNLSGSTTFTGKTSGSITNDKSASISSSIGTVNVTIDSGSTWKLTGNSTISSITGSGSIDYNGYTLTVGSTTYSSGDISTVSASNTSSSKNSSSKSSGATSSATKKVKFKNISKTIKYSKLKKKAVSYSIIKKSGGGKVTYKVTKGKKKYIKVSKKGKVTLKKGTKKGTYKIKITVAKKGKYKKTTKTIKIVVK